MVILITGASHTGKTLLAQRMLEKYKYPYLSVDHLKMGLIRSGNTPLTPCDDEELTGYLWPIVREIIKTAVENRQDLIIEGCYVPFEWRRDFDGLYRESIRFICLCMTDAFIDANFDLIRHHSSDIESRLDDAGLTASFLKYENRRFMEGFENAGELVTIIDGRYEDAIAGILADTAEYVRRARKAKSQRTRE